MSSANSLRIKFSRSGSSILGVPIKTLGGDRIQINDNIYNITPEIHKALSSTTYTGRTMKVESDILMLYNITGDLRYTGRGDRQSNRKTFFTTALPKLVEKKSKQNF